MRNTNNELCYSIWEQGQNTIINSKFEVASDTMNDVMDRTRLLLHSSTKYTPLIEGISAINFHENRNGNEMMITLCNGLPLCPNFPELASELASELRVKAVIGRARKEKLVSNNSSDDFVIESMKIRDVGSDVSGGVSSDVSGGGDVSGGVSSDISGGGDVSGGVSSDVSRGVSSDVSRGVGVGVGVGSDVSSDVSGDVSGGVSSDVSGSDVSSGDVSGDGNDGDDDGVGKVHVPYRTIRYRQPEGSFSNPNGDIAEITANWLCHKMRIENMKSQNRKFIEFYSGNANHSCYLAEYFTEVLGVEIDKELCNAATINLEMNGITNGVIINKPAEEVAKRRHLYHFDSNDFLLVDPPRAGLDTLTLGLVREFQSVIYIACDARSLARDLEEKGLGVSHTVKYMAAFDHFPWHAEFLEVVCWLEKKDVVSTSS
jgi:hypothetical protein